MENCAACMELRIKKFWYKFKGQSVYFKEILIKVEESLEGLPVRPHLIAVDIPRNEKVYNLYLMKTKDG